MNQNELLTEAHAQEVDLGKDFSLAATGACSYNRSMTSADWPGARIFKENAQCRITRGRSLMDIGSGSGLFRLAALAIRSARLFFRLRSSFVRLHD